MTTEHTNNPAPAESTPSGDLPERLMTYARLAEDGGRAGMASDLRRAAELVTTPTPSDEPLMITFSRGDRELSACSADDPQTAVVVAIRLLADRGELLPGDALTVSRV